MYLETVFSTIFLSIIVSIVHGNPMPLRDSPREHSGQFVQTLVSDGTAIIHKVASQAEAMFYCEHNHSAPARLLVLKSKEKAEDFVDKLYDISEKANSGENAGKEELNFFLGLSRRYWIGLSDETKEENWIWLRDGSELSYDDMWTRGQPDHMNKEKQGEKNDHCVTLWNPYFTDKSRNKHTFNDENCLKKYYFICENKPTK